MTDFIMKKKELDLEAQSVGAIDLHSSWLD